MTFRKLIGKLHLWLGLSSGLVVFFLAITGCIYAFQAEIKELTRPYMFVEKESRPILPPSVLRPIADKALPEKVAHSVLYQGGERAAQVTYYKDEPDNYYYNVFLNPYSGEILKVKYLNADFFHIILQGHFYLWLPHEIGQPIAASATLIFVVMLISGIILWWPKNKSARKQRFSIKWSARWRRKNYDLHNVLGFYASWIVIFIALTGLVWGFQWFRNSVYAATSGGRTFHEYQEPLSDMRKTEGAIQSPEDLIWNRMTKEHVTAETIEVHFPENDSSSILAAVNPDASTYWQIDYRFFDRYTLKELSVDHMWGRYHEATAADKLMRMNYDIHVGGIWGLPGKFLAFFGSLITASLPVTGFMIWYGRRKKKAKGETREKQGIPSRRKPVDAEMA